jgi:hypothetical protein
MGSRFRRARPSVPLDRLSLDHRRLWRSWRRPRDRGHAADAQYRARPQAASGRDAMARALAQSHGLPVHIFRLAGIYGPGRNQLLSLSMARRSASSSKARSSAASMSRISPMCSRPRSHAPIPAAPTMSAMTRPRRRRMWWPWRGTCWACPCRPIRLRGGDAVAHGAELLCRFEARLECAAEAELGVKLTYPTFREGLGAIARDLRRHEHSSSPREGRGMEAGSVG